MSLASVRATTRASTLVMFGRFVCGGEVTVLRRAGFDHLCRADLVNAERCRGSHAPARPVTQRGFTSFVCDAVVHLRGVCGGRLDTRRPSQCSGPPTRARRAQGQAQGSPLGELIPGLYLPTDRTDQQSVISADQRSTYIPVAPGENSPHQSRHLARPGGDVEIRPPQVVRCVKKGIEESSGLGGSQPEERGQAVVVQRPSPPRSARPQRVPRRRRQPFAGEPLGAAIGD